MSGAALSSAKQRRSVLKDARGNPLPTQMKNPEPIIRPSTQPSVGTIQPTQPQIIPVPQALALFDRRINALEQTVKNLVQQQTTPGPLIVPNQNVEDNSNYANDIAELRESVHRLNEMIINQSQNQEIIEDMHTFASELDGLKNTIIKLQSYTMDVNKMLLEERNGDRDNDNTPTLIESQIENGIVIE